MQKIVDTIMKICLEELSLDLSRLNNIDQTLIEIGLDSIGLMTLIVYLEDYYSIEIVIDHIFQKSYTEVKLSDVINLVNIDE